MDDPRAFSSNQRRRTRGSRRYGLVSMSVAMLLLYHIRQIYPDRLLLAGGVVAVFAITWDAYSLVVAEPGCIVGFLLDGSGMDLMTGCSPGVT